MSTTTLRYYSSTLAYTTRDRRIRLKEMKRRFRTKISRRKARQQLQQALRHITAQ